METKEKSHKESHVVVQSLSQVSKLTLCYPMDCSRPGSSPRVCSNSCPLSHQCYLTISCSITFFSFCLYSFPVSGSFSGISYLHQVVKYWSFSISPSSEYSGLISFRIDLFNLLAAQGNLKSLLQHHSSKASSLRLLAFLMNQLSHPCMTIGKTIALTLWIFVSKVIYLLLNTLSRFVIAFLPRSKHLLISCLQPPSTMILEPKKIKSVTVSTFSPSICHELMGLDAMILVFLMLSFKLAFSLSSFTPIKRKSYPSGNQNAIISANALYFILRTNDIYWLCLSKSILKIRFVFPKNF